MRLQLRILAPRRLERLCAADTIAEMTHKKDIQVGVIVVLQHEIVLGCEEGWTVSAFRLHEGRLNGALGLAQVPAISRPETFLDPVSDWLRHLRHADAAVRIFRSAYFVGPMHARYPAFAGELFGSGGKRVRHRMPNVGAAVAVEVDCRF